jgi:chromosome segregation ATPase
MVVDMNTRDIASLQAVLEKTKDAQSGIRSQMEATQERLSTYRDSLARLDEQEVTHTQEVRRAESAKEDAENTLRQARTAAMLNADTSLEASSNAVRTDAEIDLSKKKTNVTQAKVERDKFEKSAAKERLQERQVKDKLELGELKKQLESLEVIYRETHAELGEATYEALVQELQSAQETVDTLADVLKEHRAELQTLQDTVVAKLRDWPTLVRQMQKEVDATLPVEEPASIQVAKEMKRYLKKLSSLGSQIESTRNYARNRVVQLLAINEQAIHAAMLPGFAPSAEDRLMQVDDYINQVQQQIQERNWSVQRYS